MEMFKLYASTAIVTVQAFANPNPWGQSVSPNELPDAVAAAGATQDEGFAKRSSDSEAMLPYWNLTDDIVIGQDAIKARGEQYLPKFPLEVQSDYDFRLKLGKFTNVYRDIVEALAAKPFEEEVSLVKGDDDASIPPDIETFIEDVDGSGNNLTVFAAQTFFNGINSAVDWIFVDYANTQNASIKTRADEKAAGIRPHWSHVLGRNVLDAKSQIINGVEQWSYIKIWEPGEPNHIRVMERVVSGAQYAVYEERLDAITQKKIYVLIENGPISIGVIPMTPFMTGRRDGKRYFFYPAMRDAADLQIELYQSESDLKFAKKLTAYPMLAGNGVKPERDSAGKPLPIGIGPGRVVYAPPDGNRSHGEFVFIEPNATSLNFLSGDIKDTISNLRELGRQPLTAQSGNLTVITTAVAAGKAKSAVSAWALNLKNCLENALVLTCMWMGIGTADYEPEVNVYTEFDQFADTQQDLTAITAARAAGDISRETMWSEWKRRRVLSPEFDADAEKKRLLEEMPGDEELDANGMPVKRDPLTGKVIPMVAPVKKPVVVPGAK